VLGALTLYASRWIIPDRIYPWLAGLSGLIIAALGMGIFVRRIRNRRAEPSCRRPHTHTHGRSGSGHAHEHPHEHFHDHRHLDSHRHDIFGRHIHDAEAASGGARSISTRGLLALGISGGIVPCPAALVVLLSALSFNRAAFGLFLIVAFSAGLAAVLIGFGLAVVYARRLLIDRIDPQGGLVVRWLPIISSAVITVAGCAITLQALANGGVINLGR